MIRGKVRPQEHTHAAYPRLENQAVPLASKALPVCYASDLKGGKACFEPRTYDLERVTCTKCKRVVAKYQQLPALLELAKSFEQGIN